MEAAIIDNVKMCICLINDSLNRSEWVHHYSKIPIQQQSLTIYQSCFVTLSFISFSHQNFTCLINILDVNTAHN